MNNSVQYYEGVSSGSIYRTKKSKFSDGTPTLIIQRWNRDFENWSGHISNYEKTREELKKSTTILEISEKKANQKTGLKKSFKNNY